MMGTSYEEEACRNKAGEKDPMLVTGISEMNERCGLLHDTHRMLSATLVEVASVYLSTCTMSDIMSKSWPKSFYRMCDAFRYK